MDGKGAAIGNNGDIVEVAGKWAGRLMLQNRDGRVGQVERKQLEDKTGRLLVGFGHAMTMDAALGITSGEHINALPRGSGGMRVSQPTLLKAGHVASHGPRFRTRRHSRPSATCERSAVRRPSRSRTCGRAQAEVVRHAIPALLASLDLAIAGAETTLTGPITGAERHLRELWVDAELSR